MDKILKFLKNQPDLKLDNLDSRETSLMIVDMINGFVKDGALQSDRAKTIIPNIIDLSKKCDNLDINKIAFADSHTDESPEFTSYPKHCMKGSYEEEIIDELKIIGDYKLILKNSTNGFLEEEFQSWLNKNKEKVNFILTGVCTDICILQFANTLKAWFNMNNIKSRIIVPINCVETYELDIHKGDLMNAFALYNMHINGVEIVKSIN